MLLTCLFVTLVYHCPSLLSRSLSFFCCCVRVFGRDGGWDRISPCVCPTFADPICWNHSVRLSRCSSLSGFCLDDISRTAQPFLNKYGNVYYHEMDCHAEKLIHYLQGQGHSEGFYSQNIIVSHISSKLWVCFATKLGLILQHHTPECPMEKIGLLRSRSGSHLRFKMSMNVCLDDIFDCRIFCYQT